MSIEPTVGRVLLYFPGPNDPLSDPAHATDQPLAALVCYVHGEGKKVNLAVFSPAGHPFGRPDVPLIQPEDDPPGGVSFARWMPYQVGQAQKTQALQKELGGIQSAAGAAGDLETTGALGSSGQEPRSQP